MSKTGKVVLGVVTAWPLAYLPIFVGFWIYMAAWVFADPRGEQQPPGVIAVFVLHGLTVLLLLALVFFYLIHLFQNDRVSSDVQPL